MIRLIDLYEVNFRKLFVGVSDLVVGEYEIKKYYIFDNEKFVKTVYFDTTIGMFKSTSLSLVSAMITGIGKILQEQFDKGETVFIEVVNMKSLRGKFGLTFRLI